MHKMPSIVMNLTTQIMQILPEKCRFLPDYEKIFLLVI